MVPSYSQRVFADRPREGKALKEAFAQKLLSRSDSVFLYSKGRVALYALLKSLGIGPDVDVLMSGYTCVMVPSAPLYLGAACRYVDIDPATYNLNPALLDSLYTPRTKVLIVQHTYGIAQNMDQIVKWAAEKGIAVVEDCCHAFGSRYQGKLCGTFGVGAFFSGQWNKPFSTGLGGMLLVNDRELLPAVRRHYTDALDPPAKEDLLLSLQIMAYRALVTPRTTAALAVAYRTLSRLRLVKGSSSNEEFVGQMPKGYLKKMARSQIREGERNLAGIDRLIAHRRKIADYYSGEAAAVGFRPLADMPGCDNVLLRYPVRVANKDEVLKKALSTGVEIGSWFEIPLHPKGIEMERFGYRAGMCPESEKACAEVVNLPTHGKITMAEAERVLVFLGKHARFV